MSEEVDSPQDFAKLGAAALGGDVKKSSASAGLVQAAAAAQTQRTDQQKTLFKTVKCLVIISFVAMILLILSLGLECLKLPPSAQVAAIAAVGVQPFVLIGILTTSVYRDPPSQVSE